MERIENIRLGLSFKRTKHWVHLQWIQVHAPYD